MGDKDTSGLALNICDEVGCDPQLCLRVYHCSRVQFRGRTLLDQGRVNCHSRGNCNAGLEMWAVLSTVGVAPVANGSTSFGVLQCCLLVFPVSLAKR